VATSISAVEASQPGRLLSAADEVGAQLSQLTSLIATQRDAVTQLRDGWSGQAADAAIARAVQHLANQEALRDQMQILQDVLTSGGGQLDSARSALLDMVSQLRGQGWDISDDGVATAPPYLSEVFHSFPQAYTQLIQKLLETYDVIDDETAGRLPTFDSRRDVDA
jgi:hypothetical protein